MKEDRYHHGDLRRALLDAALGVVEERGLQGLTLREVARKAGVSHAAPYHHFADKAAIIKALAVEGFAALTSVLNAAWQGADGDELARLKAAGVAYVRFALAHPAVFRLMYRPELRSPEGESGELDQISRQAFDVLIQSLGAAQRAGLVAPGDTRPLAFTAWVTVHGLATLLLDGSPDEMLKGEVGEGAALALAAQVTETLVRGLRA